MEKLKWSKGDLEGSYHTKGKHNYYTIIARGIPKGRPKDCVIELFVTGNYNSASEIKVKADSEKIEPVARAIIIGNTPPIEKISRTVRNMKRRVRKRENRIRSQYLL